MMVGAPEAQVKVVVRLLLLGHMDWLLQNSRHLRAPPEHRVQMRLTTRSDSDLSAVRVRGARSSGLYTALQELPR